MNNPTNTLMIGKIEYLSCKGAVKYATEYSNKDLMIKEMQDCLNYGIPITIVLYRNKNGQIISKEFVEGFDCLPAGFKEIDNPYLANV